MDVVYADTLPNCYKDGRPPDLSKYTWEELVKLAVNEYNIKDAPKHSHRDVTERAILACHTEKAKEYRAYIKEITNKIFGTESINKKLEEVMHGELARKMKLNEPLKRAIAFHLSVKDAILQTDFPTGVASIVLNLHREAEMILKVTDDMFWRMNELEQRLKALEDKNAG